MSALPAIGSPARETLETLMIAQSDELLANREVIREALRGTYAAAQVAGWDHEGCIDLVEHVEQVWIGRILR